MSARTGRRLVISPSPPILLPGATGREAVPEVERLRAVVQQAVRWLLEPDAPVLVLTTGPLGRVSGGATLSAAAFGLRYRSHLGDAAASGPTLTPRTPGLLVAGYLLGDHPAEAVEVADVAAAGRHVAGLDVSAVLVCGGGTARRRDGAPGYVDPRAIPFDDELVERIAAGNVTALSDADPQRADELLCDLTRPLAVAAQLAGDWPQPVHAQVDAYCAPHGVANIVARWWTDA